MTRKRAKNVDTANPPRPDRRFADPPGGNGNCFQQTGKSFLFQHRAWKLAIPAILFLFFLLLRYPFMNAGLFHCDEAILAQAVEKTWQTGSLAPAVNGRYGAVLLAWLLSGPARLTGGNTAETAVLWLGLLGGAALVAGVYFLAVSWQFDRLSALLASLLLGGNALFLVISTTGKEQAVQVALLILALALVQTGFQQKRWPWRVAGLVLYCFSVTVHESSLVFLPVLLSILLAGHFPLRKNWKSLLPDLAVLASGLAIPAAAYLGGIISRTMQDRNTMTVSFLGLFSPQLPPALGQFYQVLGIPLLVSALSGLLELRRRPAVWIPLLVWLGLIFYFGNTTGFVLRHLLGLLVPAAILAGHGAASLAGWFKRLPVQWTAAGLLVAAMTGSGLWSVFPLLNYRRHTCGPKEMALYAARQTPPEALLLTMDESPHIAFYARREVWTHPPHEYEANRALVERVLQEVRRGRPVFIYSSAFSYDRKKHFRSLIEEHFRMEPCGEVADEGFHRPELALKIFTNKLFRLLPRRPGS